MQMDENEISKRNMNDLLDDLNNNNWDIRVKAVLNLKNHDNPKVNNALISRLNDDDNENVWLSAANVLKNRKDPRIIDSFILTLSDERDEVRWHSIQFLGQIGDKKAVDPIIKALKDKSKIQIF